MKERVVLVLNRLCMQPLWLKLIILLVVLFLVILLGYSTVVSMRYKEKNNAFALEQKYKKELIKNIAHSKLLPILQQQVDTLQGKFNASLQTLPSDSELPQLIELLSDIAFQTGLKVKVLNPEPVSYKDHYAILSIQLVCNGAFEQLSDFVNKLETLPRIILIENYRIVPASVSANDTLQMSMNLQTFSLKSKPAKNGE